jgi:hypothetical protein
MAQAPPLPLAKISLRRKERGLLAGGTTVGKTLLSDKLGAEFMWRFRGTSKRNAPRQHISDTKPRYRAELYPNGLSARRRYKDWDHGATVPGSVLVTGPDDMETAFKLGYHTTICSTEEWAPEQDACIGWFHEHAKASRPQLLRVDETVDHFHGNGMVRGRGKLVTVARAGAEKGESALYCTQRTKGIAGSLMEHMTRLYAFRMDNAGDAKRFAEFGAPPEMATRLPEDVHLFLYWWKGDYRRVWGPYYLDF